MNNKIILDLCGGTGSWSEPYKQNGYEVILVTLPENDVFNYMPPNNVYGILAAPPCTEFSTAKNRNIKRDLKKGMSVVNACLQIIKNCNPMFYAIENPSGLLSNYLGRPNFSFHPYEFGDGWTKKTCLWGNFNIPKKTHTWETCKKINGLYIKPNSKKPSIAALHKKSITLIPQLKHFTVLKDADFRAITPPGFAKEFFKANK